MSHRFPECCVGLRTRNDETAQRTSESWNVGSLSLKWQGVFSFYARGAKLSRLEDALPSNRLASMHQSGQSSETRQLDKLAIAKFPAQATHELASASDPFPVPVSRVSTVLQHKIESPQLWAIFS